MSCNNRIVVVTGGASGIGAATVRKFAMEGACTAIVDIDIARAEDLSMQLNREGAKTLPIRCDVTSYDEVCEVAAAVSDEFGKSADVLINNAAQVKGGRLGWETTLDDWHSTVAGTLDSVFYFIKAFAADMVAQEYGRIINVASAAGVVGISRSLGYSAAKAGVIGIARSLAKDFADSGVTVNTVSPGPIETPLLLKLFEAEPEAKKGYIDAAGMGRLGTPEEVASLIGYLASEQAGFITGQNHVIGGLRTLGY